MNPDNKIEVLELYVTCKEFGQSPSDYWFPGIEEDCPEAKYVIDRDVMIRGRELYNEARTPTGEVANGNPK